jgi:hypothetical protein
MRYRLFAVVLLAAPLSCLCAADSVPARKIQKVAIVNLAWDNARAAAVELGIRDHLVKKGVFADSVRALTLGEKKPAGVEELAALIKSQGYDSLLCIGARKTMRITPADHLNDFSTLDSCLSIFLTGKYPSGMSLRSEPFVVEAQPTVGQRTAGEISTSRTPFPTNAAAAPVTYYKRTLRVFDVPTQTLFWEKKIMLKMPRDLQESGQTSWIARETAKMLEQSGLLP